MTEEPDTPLLPPPPPPAPERTAPFPTWPQALVLCILLLVLMLGGNLAMSVAWATLRFVTGRALSDLPPVILLGLVNVASFFFVIAVAFFWSGAPVRELIPLRRFSFWLLLPMTLSVVGSGFLISELTNLLSRYLPMPDVLGEVFDEMLSSPWQGFVVLVIIAPITEELFFRGVLLRGFLRNYSAATAFVLSSLLFGFIHLNPWQFVGAFLLGIVFAWWRLHTGSLLPSLYGHALNNSLPLIMIYVAGLSIPGYTEPTPAPAFQPLWFDATGLLLVLVGFGWTWAVFRRNALKNNAIADQFTEEFPPPFDSEDTAG